MQIHKNEIATGILVLVTFGIFITVLVLIGMPGLIKPLHSYRIYYDNADGIRPGASVLLAGREIGKVTALHSPVPMAQRPPGHPDYEVLIDIRVARDAEIYRHVTVHLSQQSLMGQQVIDFVHGDETSGLAENHALFVGERVPGLSEAVSNNITRLTGPNSDLSLTLQNAKTFMETLNRSNIPKVIDNTEQLTDTLKRQPWRLLWPSTKTYPEDNPSPSEKKKRLPQ